MLRKHFAMSGDNKPDYTITYHAPKHVPFFGGYAKNWVYGYPSYRSGLEIDENPIKFKIIGDKWNNGIGEWKFKLEDSSNKIYNSVILGEKMNDSGDILNEMFSHGVGTSDSYVKVVLDENDNIISQTEVDNTNIITSIIFGEGIETINGTILMDANGQNPCAEITLPESVTLLTGYTFGGYKKLKSLTIPENVTRIDNLVYAYTNITSSERNDGLEKIIMHPINPPDSSNAQYNDPLGEHNANYLINPDFKIRVYADAIDNYKNDSIWGQYSDLYDTINDTIVYYTAGSRKLYTEDLDITSIKEYCVPQNATKVYLPNSVVSIGECSFYNYLSLTSVTIPDSVTSIDSYAFAFCSSLTSVTIPNLVTIIEDDAFRNCGITSITIHDSVTSIDLRAFYECRKLTSVEIGNSVTSIGVEAFSGCSGLTSIVIPNSVAYIYSGAFSRCSGLTAVTLNSTNPPSLYREAFANTPSNLIFYVPDESVDAYKTATNWSSYADKIKPISEKPA